MCYSYTRHLFTVYVLQQVECIADCQWHVCRILDVFVGERLIFGPIVAQGPIILQCEDTAIVDVTISFGGQVLQRTFLHIKQISLEMCMLNSFKSSGKTVPRIYVTELALRHERFYDCSSYSLYPFTERQQYAHVQ